MDIYYVAKKIEKKRKNSMSCLVIIEITAHFKFMLFRQDCIHCSSYGECNDLEQHVKEN